jgi:hypothetical protein
VVQRTALEAARAHGLPLTVCAIGGRRATVVGHGCA